MRLVASAAAALVAPGKGILDADEGVATISARLTAAGIPATRENRRACREMLITTPGLAEGISGVTLCDETLRQDATLGRTFPVALYALGMMAGIRVDAGRGPLAGTRGEMVTEGLDGLLPRLRHYAELGAQFARWRAVLRIAPGMPSAVAVRANAQALGRYAAACQDAGLVPVVEPEVQMGGHAAHPAPVAADVLVRPRTHRPGAGGLARRALPMGGRAAGTRPPGGNEYCGPIRPLLSRAGTGLGLAHRAVPAPGGQGPTRKRAGTYARRGQRATRATQPAGTPGPIKR